MPLDESCPQAPLGKWRALRPRGGCTHHARHSVLATTRRTHCHAPNTRPSAAGQRPRRLSQQLLRDAAEKIVRKAQSRTPHDTCIAHVELHQVAALEPHRARANARAPLQRFNAVRARAPAGRHCLQQLLQLPQRSAGAAREEFRSAPAAWLGTGRGGAGAGPGRGRGARSWRDAASSTPAERRTPFSNAAWTTARPTPEPRSTNTSCAPRPTRRASARKPAGVISP